MHQVTAAGPHGGATGRYRSAQGTVAEDTGVWPRLPSLAANAQHYAWPHRLRSRAMVHFLTASNSA